MFAAVDSMDEASKPTPELRFAGAFDDLCRIGPERCEYPIDAPPGSHDVSKRKAGCDEAGDLLVARLLVTVDAIDRVAAPCRLRVKGGKQSVQAFLDAVHFA